MSNILLSILKILKCKFKIFYLLDTVVQYVIILHGALVIWYKYNKMIYCAKE